jgi:hypothetical protein
MINPPPKNFQLEKGHRHKDYISYERRVGVRTVRSRFERSKQQKRKHEQEEMESSERHEPGNLIQAFQDR